MFELIEQVSDLNIIPTCKDNVYTNGACLRRNGTCVSLFRSKSKYSWHLGIKFWYKDRIRLVQKGTYF